MKLVRRVVERAQEVREKKALLCLWIVSRCLADGKFRTEDYYAFAEGALGLSYSAAAHELETLERLGLARRGETIRDVICAKLADFVARVRQVSPSELTQGGP